MGRPRTWASKPQHAGRYNLSRSPSPVLGSVSNRIVHSVGGMYPLQLIGGLLSLIVANTIEYPRDSASRADDAEELQPDGDVGLSDSRVPYARLFLKIGMCIRPTFIGAGRVGVANSNRPQARAFRRALRFAQCPDLDGTTIAPRRSFLRAAGALAWTANSSCHIKRSTGNC